MATASEGARGPRVKTDGAAAAPLSPHERATAIKTVEAPPARESGPEDEAVVATPPTIEDAPPVVDESAEAEFLAEAKARGEVVPRRNAADIEEEAAPKALPALNDLVQRIPADVRETLEDLFRARFTTVKKFPKKSLKS